MLATCRADVRGTRTHQQTNMLYVFGVCLRELAPSLDISRVTYVLDLSMSKGTPDESRMIHKGHHVKQTRTVGPHVK